MSDSGNGRVQRADLRQFVSRRDIVLGLHVHPELRRGSERRRETLRRVHGHGRAFRREAFDPRAGDKKVTGEGARRHAERLKILLAQNAARMNREFQCSNHFSAHSFQLPTLLRFFNSHQSVRSIVVIDNFDVPCVSVAPNETDTPLVVDAYGAPPLTVARQRVQPVARRGAQIVKRLAWCLSRIFGGKLT